MDISTHAKRAVRRTTVIRARRITAIRTTAHADTITHATAVIQQRIVPLVTGIVQAHIHAAIIITAVLHVIIPATRPAIKTRTSASPITHILHHHRITTEAF